MSLSSRSMRPFVDDPREGTFRHRARRVARRSRRSWPSTSCNGDKALMIERAVALRDLSAIVRDSAERRLGKQLLFLYLAMAVVGLATVPGVCDRDVLLTDLRQAGRNGPPSVRRLLRDGTRVGSRRSSPNWAARPSGGAVAGARTSHVIDNFVHVTLGPLPCQRDDRRFWEVRSVTFSEEIVTTGHRGVHAVTPRWCAKWCVSVSSGLR
jgi:hypothetical protein